MPWMHKVSLLKMCCLAASTESLLVNELNLLKSKL